MLDGVMRKFSLDALEYRAAVRSLLNRRCGGGVLVEYDLVLLVLAAVANMS